MTNVKENVDPAEVAKFDALAARWWDPQGQFKTLHDINPLRLGFIDARARIAGKTVIDVGCGGGLLADGMAGLGARVTGIDLAESSLSVARLHLLETGRQVDYRCISAEGLAAQSPAAAGVVTCMELLEHVPDPAALVRSCAELARPGGHLFFSTLNRTPKAYMFAIVGAEYVLRMLPQGTHDYARFIRPSELGRWLRAAGLEVRELAGLSYNPITRHYTLGHDVDVNYLVHAVKAG
ncbi:MAG: bifunctional 2-polyprenyl-6-hydroxyphenol methylase/3-demethylubiquinol 3-O-methyltransferase UbiG [Gammaproteobacteria bacterium]|nr:bifunctional 2-polyprenyl-6-hydroxyphenol methylase/3-demethylubiquinol 3-O-methyltransferase UbiG [Gammaproteobacteria bacterium]